MAVLPSQDIRSLIDEGTIHSGEYAIEERQIQPASLDLRLGSTMYVVPGEFLPSRTIGMEWFLYKEAKLVMSITGGALIQPGITYVIPLKEKLRTTDKMSAKANPKSTTGRLGISTRLVTNGFGSPHNSFDVIHGAYDGALYLIVSTRVFEFIVREGDTLHQIRFSNKSTYDDCENVSGVLDIPIDLNGLESTVVAYRAKEKSLEGKPVDLRERNYSTRDYWEEIHYPKSGWLLLSPGYFYIMASATKVSVPTWQCGEMVPYDARIGEFRIHMAGFFDPGFGYGSYGEVDGAHSVFEIVPHAPTFIVHGQTVAKLKMESMTASPESAYGQQIASNYQAQKLALAKHFA